MSIRTKSVSVHALALVIGLALCACSPDPPDEIREDISKGMKDTGDVVSTAERDGVSAALTEDVVAPTEAAGAGADDQARATEKVATRSGTVEDSSEKECMELQQSLTTLQEVQRAPPEGETRTEDELAATSAEIERIATRVQETCER